MASAHKWILTSFDVTFATFFLGCLAFMAISIITGIVQSFRKQKWWKAPSPLMMALMLLWMISAIAGIVAAVLNVLKRFV